MSKKKPTMKFLFVNPNKIFSLDQINKAIGNLPIMVVLEDTEHAYIVDTGIEVSKKKGGK